MNEFDFLKNKILHAKKGKKKKKKKTLRLRTTPLDFHLSLNKFG